MIRTGWASALLLGGVALMALAGGCSESDRERISTATVVEGSGALVVNAKDVSYDLDSIQVESGVSTTIVLRNADDIAHTLTVFLASEPEGGVVADTGEVAGGQDGETTVLFTSGTHAFRCQIHPDQMDGIIVVR